MKLARVEHRRCGDYAGYTYLMVPDDTTEERFQQDINEVVKEYLAALDLFNQQEPPINPLDIRTAEFPPGTTVEEARAMENALAQQRDAWYQRRTALTHDFGYYLKARGYCPLGEAKCLEAEASWGHRHGQEILYSKTQLDYFMNLAPTVRLDRKAVV